MRITRAPASGFGRGERLERLGQAQAVADGRIAGDALGQDRQPLGIGLEQQRLDPPVLVSQLNLQMQHALADAVEAEMPGLDHAGMHRSHGHLVNLLPVHGVVGVLAGDLFGVVVSEHVGQSLPVGVVADHLQPGMAFGPDAELLGDFAFEQVKRLRTRPSSAG